MKSLLILLAIESWGSPNHYSETNGRNFRPKILDLIENGKREQNGRGPRGCSPPVISQGTRLIGEVNKDCEYFGKFEHINLFFERANSFSKRNLDTGSIHIERNFFFGPSELVFQIFLESNFSTIDPLKLFGIIYSVILRCFKLNLRIVC